MESNTEIVPDTAIIVEANTVAVYIALEARIDVAESDAVETRWDFGRRVFDERVANGGKQLPHGRMEELVAATGKSSSEISYRVQFAEKYPTLEKVSNALETFGSWHGIVKDGLGTPHVAKNSGENEWYTPPQYIAAAREVMGGIDLDPASSVKANSIVQADQFYTKADDGLAQEWSGRVWLNPPYENTLISRFADKVVDEYKRDRIEAACVLVNNASDTAWFLTLAKVANARCDFTKRITYLNADLKPENTPLQGQSLLYFGGNAKKFVAVFRSMGHCWFPA